MYNKIKAAVFIRGLTMGKFYELTGYDKSTLIRRCHNGKLRVADVKKIKEALNLTREEVVSIFFEGELA